MIMFASIIPESYACSEPLFIQTHARLIPLSKRFFPSDIFFVSQSKTVSKNPYDCHISLGSLPQYFRPDLERFQQAPEVYLKADADRAARLRKDLLGTTGQNLCGADASAGPRLD